MLRIETWLRHGAYRAGVQIVSIYFQPFFKMTGLAFAIPLESTP